MFSNSFPLEENRILFASKPISSSDFVDPADGDDGCNAWNSWALPKVTRNLAHREARILEPQFPSFLLSPCCSLLPLSFLRLLGKTRRRLISVSPLNVLFRRPNERTNALLSDLSRLPRFEFRRSGTRIGLFADGRGGLEKEGHDPLQQRYPVLFGCTIGILNFPFIARRYT